MFRSLIASVLTLFALALPAMAEPQYSTPAPGYQRIDWYDNNDNRVCCTRDGQNWWSSERECRRYGGYATANRACRARDDYSYQGYDPNARVCCYRETRNGTQIWWSTFGQCARARGQFTANKVCRKYGSSTNYDNGYNGYDGYGGYGPGQDPNERVCCERSGQVWWTTRRECYRNYGQQTMNKVCRKAY